MTQSTCTQKVTIFIFLIAFVSSISPVVAPKSKNIEVGQSSSNDQRSLTVTVHVEIRMRTRFIPEIIVAILVPVRTDPDQPYFAPREIRIQWTDCEIISGKSGVAERKCKFEFSPDAEFFATDKYSLGVAANKDFFKKAYLAPKIHIEKNQAVQKDINQLNFTSQCDIYQPQVEGQSDPSSPIECLDIEGTLNCTYRILSVCGDESARAFIKKHVAISFSTVHYALDHDSETHYHPVICEKVIKFRTEGGPLSQLTTSPDNLTQSATPDTESETNNALVREITLSFIAVAQVFVIFLERLI
ncbi:hypothetical protein DdX_10695 [Ditylenchus destructor]|uniref:Uncharacterized protein n=1 Tax=Ditylenchus destructor TaxID=166010 RepID=A0AAD4N1C1_9BILA|nr:hypothetical protein DdX_10695 [Ditylenchus destructor]